MRTFPGLLLLLSLGMVALPLQAVEIYKCREATGKILYTDAPCDAEAETIAIMPPGGTHFDSPDLSDSAITEHLELLSEQEATLIDELDQAQAAPGESLNADPEAHALRVQIQAELESVRRQKVTLLGRGLSKDEGEELVMESGK